MRRSILIGLSFIICHLSFSPAGAQSFTALWATGSAVPGGVQQLEQRPDGQFRYAGPLNVGELKVQTTATAQPGTTQYLRPQLVDSYLINNGLQYMVTTDADQPGWVVSFQEDTYCFTVDPFSRRLTGQLLLPWNEVLLAGSAFAGGANSVEWSRDAMLSFERDRQNPYRFTWIGELGVYDDVVEPGRFKLEGQMTWGPRELHPYTQDEDLLQSTQMRQGGDDTKWRVSQHGTYRITVDLLTLDFHAELQQNARSGEANGISTISDASTATQQHRRGSTFFSLDGRRLTARPSQPGLYISGGRKMIIR